MITGLANIIADFFIRKGIIDKNEHEIYVYGCEAILSALTNLIIVVLSGILTNEFLNIFIFYLVFLVMRKYCGGYHAKTHLRCNLIFTLNIWIVVLLIKNISITNMTFYVTAIIISNILIFWLAPIENENKPLEKKEVNKYRKIAIFFSLIFTVIAVLLMFIYKTVSIIIILAMLSVSLAMLVAKLMKEVEVKKHED
ncbi:MAG: accessory gene regulator B family protein [Clostridium sp.]|nr:accessory gene regulator B family protein [Clostridium sp.]